MTEKILCPNCNASIYDNLRFCPKCGEKIYIQNFRDENLGDLYKILQVDPSAEPEVIEAAYKRLAAKYHPDVNKSPDAQTRMQEINKAYTILSKEETRRQYDLTRAPKSGKTEKPKQEQPQEKAPERKAQTQYRPAPSRPVKSKPSTSLRWIFIIIAVILGVSWLASLASAPTTPSRPAALPTRTRRPTPHPTDIPTRVHNPTPARSDPNCILWKESLALKSANVSADTAWSRMFIVPQSISRLSVLAKSRERLSSKGKIIILKMLVLVIVSCLQAKCTRIRIHSS